MHLSEQPILRNMTENQLQQLVSTLIVTQFRAL